MAYSTSTGSDGLENNFCQRYIYNLTKYTISSIFCRGVGILIHVKRQMKGHFRKQSTVADIFHDTVLKHPNKLAMVSVDTGTRLTFTEAEALANQVGNIFYGLGLQKGDVVALYMESSPEYICLWLGLSKIGVITALINFNLRQESLTHCINISKPKAIIYSPTLAGESLLP